MQKAKVEAKRSVFRKSSKNEGARIRDVDKRLAEALEQQTATSEILRVIRNSPTDVQPIFDAIPLWGGYAEINLQWRLVPGMRLTYRQVENVRVSGAGPPTTPPGQRDARTEVTRTSIGA